MEFLTKIGLDLGTTYSLVSCWTPNGPMLIPNILGSHLTPSVVSVDENGEIFVGRTAKERLISHPQMTAAFFKRYMGTEKVYQLGKFSFSPIELTSLVFKSLKADAEAFLNEKVNTAVISVPTFFNDSQRKATIEAARLAGLNVEMLISEPAAAAMSYALQVKDSETKFLIFDLGGGIFEVSIHELFEGKMVIKSFAGDSFLGGESFNEVLETYFIQSHSIELKNLDLNTRLNLSHQAELCKLELTNSTFGKMKLVVEDKIIETTIDRDTFEILVNPLILRLRLPIEQALKDASLSPQDLDAIIFIGGATRMPVIRLIVAKMFGMLPFTNMEPDEAVALGGAIQVAINSNIKMPSKPAGKHRNEVQYTYDKNGSLELEVVSSKTGIKNRITIDSRPGILTAKGIVQRLSVPKNLELHAMNPSMDKFSLVGEKIYQDALGDIRNDVSDILQEFENVNSGQIDNEVKRAAKNLITALEEIEKRYES